jgi:hypothetical protein
MESEHASLWQPITDGWSNCVFYFRQWQFQHTRPQNVGLGLLAACLLTVYLAWRIYSAKRKCQEHAKTVALNPAYQGLDSEFYLIEQCLKNTDEARHYNESIQQWVGRLQQPVLNRLYQLHYRLRFDPKGLSGEQRVQLRELASTWVTKRNKMGKLNG